MTFPVVANLLNDNQVEVKIRHLLKYLHRHELDMRCICRTFSRETEQFL